MFESKMSRRKVIAGSTGLAAFLAACGSSVASPENATDASETPTPAEPNPVQVGSIDPADFPDGPLAVIDPATIPRGEDIDFGPAPDIPEGPLADDLLAAVELLYGQRIGREITDEDFEAFETIGTSGDPRVGWLIADHIRVCLLYTSDAADE